MFLGWVVENGLLFSWKKGWVGGFCTTFFLNHHCVANYVLGIPMASWLKISGYLTQLLMLNERKRGTRIEKGLP